MISTSIQNPDSGIPQSRGLFSAADLFRKIFAIHEDKGIDIGIDKGIDFHVWHSLPGFTRGKNNKQASRSPARSM